MEPDILRELQYEKRGDKGADSLPEARLLPIKVESMDAGANDYMEKAFSSQARSEDSKLTDESLYKGCM